MKTFLRDLNYSLRTFLRSPGFTITAVATLALGIGANTAVFSVVNAVLLKPIPFPDPDRLVMFMSTSPQGTGPAASPAKFQHYREQTGIVQDVSAFRTGIVNYTGGDLPEQLRSGQVSAGYFRLFGAPVIEGRTFSTDEDLPHGQHVAVISQGLWIRRFGGERNVLGKTISLSGDPYVFIGIIASSFNTAEFGTAPEVWVPFQLDPNTADQGTIWLLTQCGTALEQLRQPQIDFTITEVLSLRSRLLGQSSAICLLQASQHGSCEL